LWAWLGKHELGVLATVFLFAAALLAFIWLAEEVGEGDTGAFDRAVMLALRNPADPADPIGPSWVEAAARDMTSLGSVTVLALVSLVVIGFLGIVGKRSAALLVLVSVGGGRLRAPPPPGGRSRPRACGGRGVRRTPAQWQQARAGSRTARLSPRSPPG
jgi:undecaprenyl-diphosphatase